MTSLTRSDQPGDGPSPLAAGTVIAPGYQVIALLHRSRHFDVYDVWSDERACRCIAKLPIAGQDRYGRRVRQLQREAALLKRLTHPHIVRAYEFISEPGAALILET